MTMMAEAVSSWPARTEKSYVSGGHVRGDEAPGVRDSSEIIVGHGQTEKEARGRKKKRGRNSGKLGYKTLENYGWVLY